MLLVDALSRDVISTPGALRFKEADPFAEVTNEVVRVETEPGGGKSSMYAWTKCSACESSSRSCHEQIARGGTKGCFLVRQSTRNCGTCPDVLVKAMQTSGATYIINFSVAEDLRDLISWYYMGGPCGVDRRGRRGGL